MVVLFLLCCCVFCFVACNSKEMPLPEKYTGIYGSGQYGNLIVTTTTIATEELLLPQCVVGDTTISWEIVSWKPVSFNYYSNMTFNFNAYVESITSSANTSSAKGTTSFSGTFADNAATYDIHLTYYGSSQIWFAKSK